MATAESSAHQVTVGIGRHPVSVMRFFPQRVVINVGDTVTFTDRDPMDTDPHSVTWVPASFAGTIDDGAVFGDPTQFDGSKPLGSGPLGDMTYDQGRSFQVTFTKAGTYAFYCAWHDFMSKKLTVVVRH
jgi:plastocyanin